MRSIPYIFLALSAIPFAVAKNSAWYIDTLAGMDRPIRDGGPATNAILNQPGAVVIDGSGALIVADSYNHRVRRITPDGVINTIVGTGVSGNSGDLGPALAARLVTPLGLALDSGNLYVADFDANIVRKITPAGVISAYAGTGNQGSVGDNGKALQADLNGSIALAFDQIDDLFIADYYNDDVREVTPDGQYPPLRRRTQAAGSRIRFCWKPLRLLRYRQSDR